MKLITPPYPVPLTASRALPCVAGLCLSLLIAFSAFAQNAPPQGTAGARPGVPGLPPQAQKTGPERVPFGALRADTPASGAGYHSPQSRFPPLKEREGVVSWSVLSAVVTRIENNRLRPIFSKPAQALDQKKVTLQGFMMPLEPGRTQGRFLLSAVPTTCQFCTPAGPEGLVEIRSKSSIPFVEDAILLRGRLELLHDDKSGLYYRLSEATLSK